MNLDALSGDDDLYEERVELRDIWRVLILSLGDLQDELHGMEQDHRDHAAVAEAERLLGEACKTILGILER